MQRLLIPIVLAIAVVSCDKAQDAPDTSAIEGHWRVVVIESDQAPSECLTATVVIDSAKVRSRTGSLEIEAAYRAEKIGSRFRLQLSSVSNNGGSNCQGLSADYVMENFESEMEVERLGDRLRIYDPGPDDGGHIDFIRADVEKVTHAGQASPSAT